MHYFLNAPRISIFLLLKIVLDSVEILFWHAGRIDFHFVNSVKFASSPQSDGIEVMVSQSDKICKQAKTLTISSCI